MKWAAAEHYPDRHGREARLEQLRVYWRMIGPSRKPLTCALYHTDAGLELRGEYSLDDLVRSEHVAGQDAAADLAAKWKAAFDAKGGFVVETGMSRPLLKVSGGSGDILRDVLH